MDQGKGRDNLRPMTTIKKGSGLGKDKKTTGPSKTNDSSTSVPGQGIRRHSLGSTLPNKSTKSPTTDGSTATKNVKKSATQTSQPQRPDPLRRSVASPASAQKKTLVSPGPQKPTTTIRSASFPSKPATSSPKLTLERVAKTPIAEKAPTLSSSSRTKTKSMKAASSPRPSIKRGTTTFSASKKPPHDKKQAKKLETNHENKEILDQDEEVVHGEIHDIQISKVEEETQQHAQVEEKYILDGVSIVTHEQQHQKPRTEEMEDKFHEQESDGSNSDDQNEEAKENDSEEETNVSHDEQEKITHEKTEIETEDKGVEEGNSNTSEEVALTEESEEENNDDGKEQGVESVEEEVDVVTHSQVEAEATDGEMEFVEEETNLVPESRVEAEAVDGDKETVEEEALLVPEVEAEAQEENESFEVDANSVPESQAETEAEAEAHEKEKTSMVPESQVQGEAAHEEEKKPNSVAESRVQSKAANEKNEPPTPNSDVVEVTTSKLVIERKGRVRALVGAFESKR